MGVDVANLILIVLAVLFAAEERRSGLVGVAVTLTPDAITSCWQRSG